MKKRYALVKFRPYTYEYTYSCDKSVKKGNIVLVPVSGYNELQKVIVSKIRYLEDDELPVSIGEIKAVSRIVSRTDVNNEFYENLDELYAFEKDEKVEKTWVKKRFEKYQFLNELPYKYSLLNGRSKLHLFADGKNFIIECRATDPGLNFFSTAKIKCSSRQERDYVLNNLKIAIYRVNSGEIDDEYYIQDVLRNPYHID